MPVRQTFSKEEVISIYNGTNSDLVKIEEFCVGQNDEGDTSYHNFVAKDKMNQLWMFTFNMDFNLFSTERKLTFSTESIAVKKYSRIQTKYLPEYKAKASDGWKEVP